MQIALRSALLGCLALLCACPSAGKKDEEENATKSELKAPANLNYETAPFALTVGEAFGPVAPYHDGGLPASFSVAPSLPDGLVFNASSGVISGTPSARSDTNVYTVTAKNDAGEAVTTFLLGVAAPPVAPSAFAYEVADATYVVNVAIAPNVPTLVGTGPITFTVDKPLPEGLELQDTSGVIIGTPNVTQASETYTVTATNSQGHTSTTVKIAVSATPVAPSLTSYSPGSATYTAGEAGVPNSPTVSGTPPFAYTIDPVLPAGLVLNPTTGVITGTPTAMSAADVYTVTVTNAVGSDTFDMTLGVNSAPAPAIAYPAGPSGPSGTYVFGAPGSSIPVIAPTGARVGTLSISPPIGNGLAFSTTTGQFSGNPNTPGDTEYTVTATNGGVTATAKVRIILEGNRTATESITIASSTAGPHATVPFTPSTSSITCGQTVEWTASGLTVAWTESVGSQDTIAAWTQLNFLAGTSTQQLTFNNVGTYSYNTHHINAGVADASITVTGPCP